jgi:hypothetical protein
VAQDHSVQDLLVQDLLVQDLLVLEDHVSQAAFTCHDDILIGLDCGATHAAISKDSPFWIPCTFALSPT